MEIVYGNRVWKSHMEIAYAGASFANSDSADLAKKIAYGNRMEIVTHVRIAKNKKDIKRINRKIKIKKTVEA